MLLGVSYWDRETSWDGGEDEGEVDCSVKVKGQSGRIACEVGRMSFDPPVRAGVVKISMKKQPRRRSSDSRQSQPSIASLQLSDDLLHLFHLHNLICRIHQARVLSRVFCQLVVLLKAVAVEDRRERTIWKLSKASISPVRTSAAMIALSSASLSSSDSKGGKAVEVREGGRACGR